MLRVFAAQSKSAGTVTVADFLYNFLKSKYGVPAAIAEAGYNLIDALTRYQVRKRSSSFCPTPFIE
eukprot:COSAG06_NODE_28276_length_577_cov_1.071130_2_plen_66_part_00